MSEVQRHMPAGGGLRCAPSKGVRSFQGGEGKNKEGALCFMSVTLSLVLLYWDITPFSFHESGIKALPTTKRASGIQCPATQLASHQTSCIVPDQCCQVVQQLWRQCQGSSGLLVRRQVLIRHLQGIP